MKKTTLREGVGCPFGLPHSWLVIGVWPEAVQPWRARFTRTVPLHCTKHSRLCEDFAHRSSPVFHTHSQQLSPGQSIHSYTLTIKGMSRRRLRDVMSRIVRHDHHASKGEGTLRQVRNIVEEKMLDSEVTYSDLTIQFIGASGLPKMDVVGSADPYFKADLGGQISIV